MKLNVKAVAIALGLVWGVLAMFVTGLANLVWPGIWVGCERFDLWVMSPIECLTPGLSEVHGTGKSATRPAPSRPVLHRDGHNLGHTPEDRPILDRPGND